MSPAVLAVIFLLILVTALYVAAEFAAVSVRQSRIRQRAEEGNWLARRLLPHIDHPHRLDHYIATSQVGITVSSLVLGAYGQAKLAPLLVPVFEGLQGLQAVASESAAAGVVLVTLTAGHMILGELVPKSLALQFPTQVALYTLLPMQWSMRSLSWFIRVLNGSGLVLLRVLGAKQQGQVHMHSPDEIEYLIAESREGGLLEADEHARLRRALRLGAMTVDQVMVPRTEILGIDSRSDLAEMLRIASESPYTRLPVYRETLDHIVGYVHVQDLAQSALLGSAMPALRSVLFIPHSLTLDRVLERLRAERQHMALVSDEFGGTAGLVTVSDILQQILGRVADEFKSADPQPERLPDGRFRLPGAVRLEEAAQLLDAEWAGSSATLAGFLMERIERLPRSGEEFVIDGVAVEVESMAGRTVVSVLAAPARADEAGRG